MFIHQIISYLGAWDRVNRDHNSELSEVMLAAENFYSGNVVLEDKEARFYSINSRRLWEKALLDFGWILGEGAVTSPAGKRVQLGFLGPTKNGISAQLNVGNPSWFHRWLFSQGALAVRYGGVRIPVLVTSMKEYERREERSVRSLGGGSYFEYLKDQLETLAPLSSNFPFLILGISDQPITRPIIVSELASDPNITTERIVIDRCIEFPPEYHQAGLGILNFFGTFLRENYPDKEAKVRIEQVGLSVRMSVETTDGNIEIIEKALKDYELVMSGKSRPESITTNEKVILDIKNELRIAQFRIESQQDIIDLQNRRIDKLMDVIGNSMLASHSRPISVSVNQNLSNTSNMVINGNISAALTNIYELLESLPPASEAYTVLNDLTGSLEAIEAENDPDKLRDSPGITKLGRFLKRFTSGVETLKTSIEGIEKGRQIVQDIVGAYNKIAIICSLPVLPFGT